jgi:hypothetical protein
MCPPRKNSTPLWSYHGKREQVPPHGGLTNPEVITIIPHITFVNSLDYLGRQAHCSASCALPAGTLLGRTYPPAGGEQVLAIR